ncbi:MAG: hypothetical protein PVJ57_11795 [Phycisphaerae bacterium]
MDLLGELLGSRNRQHFGGTHVREGEPVVAAQPLRRPMQSVPDADVNVEAAEPAAGHQRLDRKPRPSQRGALKLGAGRGDAKREVIPKINVRGFLQRLADLREPGWQAHFHIKCLDGQINVLRGAGFRAVTQFHRVPALEQPSAVVPGEEPGEQTLDE